MVACTPIAVDSVVVGVQATLTDKQERDFAQLYEHCRDPKNKGRGHIFGGRLWLVGGVTGRYAVLNQPADRGHQRLEISPHYRHLASQKNESHPMVRLHLMGQACYRESWRSQIADVRAWLAAAKLCTPGQVRFSRLDLAVDSLPMIRVGEFRGQWVSRAKPNSYEHVATTYGEGARHTGWVIGRGGYEGLQVRVYDKTRDMRIKPGARWALAKYDHLGGQWAKSARAEHQPIVRTEVEVGGGRLAELGLRDFDAVLDPHFALLWGHVTGSRLALADRRLAAFCSYRTLGPGRARDRPVTPWWSAVSAVSEVGRLVLTPRTPKAKVEQLAAQAVGVLLAMEALRVEPRGGAPPDAVTLLADALDEHRKLARRAADILASRYGRETD